MISENKKESLTLKTIHHLPVSKLLTAISVIFFSAEVYSQDSTVALSRLKQDSGKSEDTRLRLFRGKTQVDLIDIGRWIIEKHAGPRKDSSTVKAGQIYFSGFPYAQYTLQTGVAVSIGGNAAFYLSNDTAENISSIESSLNYSLKKQFFVPIELNIWTKGNKYNILANWNFSIFPQFTYGLGGFTTGDDGYRIDYNNLRLYQTVLKTTARNFYVGLGYDLDLFWNIQQVNLTADTITDWTKYGFSHNSKSSGPTLSVLYDGRRNAINPYPSNYASLVFRTNLKFLGSDNNWSSILVDLRKYIRLSESSNNILAFWSYNWFTITGNPPYLNLPNTASDEYSNLGRGYIQGRFRGKNLVYLESEYRFGITPNGLLGGVIFANAQSYTETTNNRFEKVLPGLGAGLRLKFNKFSKTNIALDYGFGIHGSSGIFANLGEVF